MTRRKMRRFSSMFDVKQRNRARGQYFFEPDTMLFFKSRVGDTLHGGHYFVTSERFDARTPRRYTVRVAHADANICTVGDFQQYATSRQANDAAKYHAAHWTPCEYDHHPRSGRARPKAA